MASLLVEGLNKRYPGFHLKDVSFSLDAGFIMGFIGINGAGKTTTLKSILNMTRPESGRVEILGRVFSEHELGLKQDLGVVLGDKDVYKNYRIGVITRVISRFYRNWDQPVYEDYCRRFRLDQEKRLRELSQGLATKYFLTLALSHRAKLFILDEPTSGLDPAARDDLLEIFQELVEDGETSILYSTHITSDLEKCADFITYIHAGKIVNTDTKDDFMEGYRIVQGSRDLLTPALEAKLISHRDHSFGFSGLVKTEHAAGLSGLTLEAPNLEDIMIYYARKEARREEPAL
jgi:ABC-2 type transport system ATP-binding protein